MLTSPRRPFTRTFLAAAAFGLASAAAPAGAATLYWDGVNTTANADGGAGVWDLASANWDTAAAGGADAVWSNATPDSAVFGGTAGTVTLGTGITAGALDFNTSGYVLSGNTLTLAGATAAVNTATGVSVSVTSVLAGTAQLLKGGDGTLTLTSGNSYSGGTRVAAGMLGVTAANQLGSGAVQIDAGATLAVDNSSMQTLAVNLDGAGVLRKSGSGVLILTGTNTHSGTVEITGGDVVLNSATAVTGSPNLVLTAGRLLLADPYVGGVAAFGNLSGTGGEVTNAYGSTAGTRTLSVNQTVDATYAGTLKDASGGRVLAFIKNGAATLTLSGANNFTGAADLRAGTVKVANSTALGTHAYALTKVLVGAGATLDINGIENLKYGMTLNGGALVNTGGALRRSQISTPFIALGADSTFGGTGNFTMIAQGYGVTTLDLAGFTLNKTGTNLIGLCNTDIGSGVLAVSGGGLEFGIGENANGVRAAQTELRLLAPGTGLTVTKASTLRTLSGVAGSTLALNADLTLADLQTDAVFAGDISGNGALTLNGPGRLVLARATDAVLAASISGTAGLVKDGAGTLLLSGASTLTGNVVVSGGTLVVNSVADTTSPTATALGNMTVAGRTITVNAGATLRFDERDAIGSYNHKAVTRIVADGGIVTRASDLTKFNSLGDIELKNGGRLIATNGNAPTVGSFALNGTVFVTGTSGSFIEVKEGQTTNSYFNLGTVGGSTTFDVSATGDAVADLTVSAVLGDRVLGGAAGLEKNGAGKMVLTAENTYTGATTVNAGTLQLGSGKAAGSLAAASVVTLGAAGTLAFNSNADRTLDNVVSGAGTIAQLGLGKLTLSGANPAFTGGLLVRSGTLLLGSAAARPGPGAITVEGGTLDANNLALTTTSLNGGGGTLAMGTGALVVTGNSLFSGVISGTGAVTVTGGANLVLAGANSYTGATSVGAGSTLTLGNGDASGALATSALTLDGGTLAFNRADSALNLATPVSVTGAGGTLRSIGTGAVTYSGAVSGVSVGNTGSGSFTVSNAGALTSVSNTGAGLTTVAASGNVVAVTGIAGTLVVQASAVTGATSVAAGSRVTVAADLQGAATVADGGTLTVGSGYGDTASRVTGPVALVGAGRLVLNTGADTTLAGVSGPGVIEIAAAKVATPVLNDTETKSVVALNLDGAFTGTIELSAGVASLATQANLGGATRLDFNGGTLKLAGTQAGLADLLALDILVQAKDNTISFIDFGEEVTDVLTLTTTPIGRGKIFNVGMGIINNADFLPGQILDKNDPLELDGQSWTVSDFDSDLAILNTGANATLTFVQTNDGTASGVLGAPAGDDFNVLKEGPATLTLTAANTYTGTTTVTGGTLRVGAGGTTGSLNPLTAITVNKDGTLAFDRSDAVTITNTITGEGTLATLGAGNTTFSGAVTVGALALRGTGTTFFDAPLTVGRLDGSGALALAAGDLTVTQGGDYSGVLSLPGALVLQTAGTLALSGDSLLVNPTRIGNGTTLQLGNGGAAGSVGIARIQNNGTLAIHRSDTFVLANLITGTGGLTQSGSGTTVVTGNNTYLGGTRITAGTLQVGNGGASGALGSGAVANDGVLVFNRSGDLTLANAISGSGAVVKQGAGLLSLTGTLSYTGTTTASAGTLRLNTAGLPAGDFAVAQGARLEFAGTGSGTLRKGISGAGAVDFSGQGGRTALTADSTHTGVITVNSGHTLQLGLDAVSGAPALASSRLEILRGATLVGSGRLTSGSLINRGTLAPGFSPGLIDVAGDFTTTGTLNMEIAGAGGAGSATGHDQIRFGGTAVLGGVLNLNFTNGFTPATGFSAVLLQDTNTADGQPSFSGNFAGVNVTGAVGRLVTSSSAVAFFVGDSVAQSPGLSLHDGVLDFANALSPSATLSHPALADFLTLQAGQGSAALSRALDNASPIGLAALTALPTMQAGREADALRQRAQSRAQAVRTPYGEGDAAWLAYAGGNGGLFDNDSGASAPYFDTRSFGGFAGLERRLGDGSLSLGLRLGYDRAMADLHRGAGDIDQDHARATLYGTALVGDAGFVTGGLGMGYSAYESKRNTINGTQKASPSGWEVSASVDAGYVFHLTREWTFTPYAGATLVSASVGAFTESGSDLALAVDGYSQNSGRARLGTALMREWPAFGFKRDTVRFGVDVAYEHTLFGDAVEIPAAFAKVPQLGEFTSEAPALVKDRLVVGPQVEWVLDESSTLSAGVRYELGFDGSSGYRGDVGYEYRF